MGDFSRQEYDRDANAAQMHVAFACIRELLQAALQDQGRQGVYPDRGAELRQRLLGLDFHRRRRGDPKRALLRMDAKLWND